MADNNVKYFDSGFPFGGVQNGTNPNGTMKFWESGFPYIYIFPAVAAPSTVVKDMLRAGMVIPFNR